jgi:hypothetical protein
LRDGRKRTSQSCLDLGDRTRCSVMRSCNILVGPSDIWSAKRMRCRRLSIWLFVYRRDMLQGYRSIDVVRWGRLAAA